MNNDQSQADQVVVTPRALSRLADRLFQGGSKKFRLMQKYRPFICPYNVLIDFVPNGSSVMDIGCGGGLFLGLLAGSDRIKQGYGFDSNSQAIATAQGMATVAKEYGHSAYLKFEMRSAVADWPDGTFDVVSLIDVMHHVPPSAQRDVIRNAAARVKPGGRFIYKDMCRRPLWRALANRLHDFILAGDWIHYAPLADVVDWTKANGLEQLHTSRINLLWYGHELVVFERPLTD